MSDCHFGVSPVNYPEPDQNASLEAELLDLMLMPYVMLRTVPL